VVEVVEALLEAGIELLGEEEVAILEGCIDGSAKPWEGRAAGRATRARGVSADDGRPP
jgi:hypothetical protein